MAVPIGRVMNPGKLAVLAIFVVAAGMALLGVLFQAHQDKQLIRTWSADHLNRIQHADNVELLLFENPPQSSAEQPTDHDAVEIGGSWWQLASREDVSEAKGISHARYVLITDSSYSWDKPVELPNDAVWEFAFVFQQDGQTSTIVLDPTSQIAYLVEVDKPLRATKMIDRLKIYVTEDLKELE